MDSIHQFKTHRGFTLVELLVVVVILGILAAIVVPQFISSTGDAEDSAAAASLQNFRAAIELYAHDHGGDLPGANAVTASCPLGAGAAESANAFWCQLLFYTDEKGEATKTKGANQHGPYLKKKPSEPFKSSDALELIAVGDLGIAATAGDPGGWKYDVKTGEIIINHSSGAGL